MCGEVDTSEMDNVWDAIRPVEHYYYKLKPIEGSIDMIHRYIEKYGDRCEILSAIPSAKKNILYTEEDKRAWVDEYISPEIKVNIVQRTEKAAFCKGPGYVLIDDFPKNVDEWRSLGGTAFLFDKSKTEEVKALDEKLAELTEEELAQASGGSPVVRIKGDDIAKLNASEALQGHKAGMTYVGVVVDSEAFAKPEYFPERS